MKNLCLRKTYIKIIGAGLALFMIASTAISQTTKLSISFIGNSITAGVYDYGKTDIQASYATRFSQMIEAYIDTLETFNAGVSGCTLCKNTSSPIWTQTKFGNALTREADICLIALGTNDSKPSRLDVVKSDFFDDYQDMINAFKTLNPDMTFVACLPPPIFDGHPYSASDPHNDTILVKYTIPLIDSVAKVNDLRLVDFHTPFMDSLQYFNDKLHPNKAGHNKMAKILFDRFIEEGLIDTVTTTGISEINWDRKIMLFPNPSKNTCSVKIPDEISGIVDIRIFDARGAAIFSQRNIKEKMYDFDLTGVNDGLYFVSIKSNGKSITNKLLVLK